MRKVFADTGYWIAMTFPADSLCEKAKDASNRLESGGPHKIFTSEMVLSELLTYASCNGKEAREAAIEAVRFARRNPNIQVHAQTSNLFEHALLKCKQSGDKEWSFTDCASFVLMEKDEIPEALAHDRHFEQAGYRTLL